MLSTFSDFTRFLHTRRILNIVTQFQTCGNDSPDQVDNHTYSYV